MHPPTRSHPQALPDLEAVRLDPEGGDPVPAIVDYKVKSTLRARTKADHYPRAGRYLAGGWPAGDPAHQVRFAQIGKPGLRRKADEQQLHRHGPHRRACG